MFRNIGKTIRVLALMLMALDVMLTIALTAVCFLTGKNVFAAAGGSFMGISGGKGGAAVALITGFCGIVALLCLYGYGQQIENIKLIREAFEEEDYEEDDTDGQDDSAYYDPDEDDEDEDY